MKNNNGFTLIELLSVIVLIGLLLGLGVPGVMKISENMKARSYKTKVNLIEQAGILWGQDNKTRLQSTPNCEIKKNDNNSAGEYNCKKITINNLIEDDYLDADDKDATDNYIYLNPETNKNIVGCEVFVYKKNNRVYAFFDKDICNP